MQLLPHSLFDCGRVAATAAIVQRLGPGLPARPGAGVVSGGRPRPERLIGRTGAES